MSDNDQRPSLKATSGSLTLDHKTITAQGQERNRLLTTLIAGIVFILLTVTYMYAFFNGRDAHELLGFITTAFGVIVGRASTKLG